jgi:hypothetical protein
MQAGRELWARPAGAGHVFLVSPLEAHPRQREQAEPRLPNALGRFRNRLCNRRIDKEDRRPGATRLFLRRNRVSAPHSLAGRHGPGRDVRDLLAERTAPRPAFGCSGR